jgi:drug/metabolite transporter (DMT)-like permease
MSLRTRFWITILTHTLLAAGTYLMGKAATNYFPVLALGLTRFLLAAVGFAIIVSLRGIDLRGMLRADGRSIVILGCLGVLLNQIGFLWGLKLTLPAHGALLYALSPTVVLLFGWLRGSERPQARKVSGIALAFLGVLVLFLDTSDASLPTHWILGDLLILVAVMSWAGFTVRSRPLVLKYGFEAATAASILMGAALYLPFGLIGLWGFHPSTVPPSAWVGAIYLGLVSSVVMYLLWFHALSLREPSRVAIVQNGQPVLTALLAWAVFGMVPTLHFLVGSVLVISGVLVTQL